MGGFPHVGAARAWAGMNATVPGGRWPSTVPSTASGTRARPRSEDAGARRNDLYDLAAPLPSYVSGRVALIGDAAHAMTPDLGRGACEALVDGVTVARELTGRARVEDALAAYDASRRRPTRRLARAARIMNRAVHTPRHIAPVRNSAMRLFLAVGRPPA
ncbi:Salicylate hydroxylase [Streptomyces sp. YIM 130001]|nr:Salicylate hydroxylase [Streptomyces sp. YIM 130001]